ncbi:hypothetical protein F4821DRAFT_260543 [Hypoxylon rubiginosum]|uniref:Uncharacterized protein n=1 Tax=Hypoxylon rubiginosum TaxID=110542 RepID=A0ACC0CZK7_9PEZI|nr:hypothetical protein F4821DRAFT_260543 [Hypoxylon rubiginosum]
MAAIPHQALEITEALKEMTQAKIPIHNPIGMTNDERIDLMVGQTFESMMEECKEDMMDELLSQTPLQLLIIFNNMQEASEKEFREKYANPQDWEEKEEEYLPMFEAEWWGRVMPALKQYDNMANIVWYNPNLPLECQWGFIVLLYLQVAFHFPRIIDEFAFWQRESHDEIYCAIFDVWGDEHEDFEVRYPGREPCLSFLLWVEKLVLGVYTPMSTLTESSLTEEERLALEAYEQESRGIADAVAEWTDEWPGEGDKIGNSI